MSRHSKPLSAKIKARNDFTIIDGVDKDTFARFIEWAYKGYYTAAEYWIDAGSPSLSKFEDSDTCTPEVETPLPCVEEAPAPTEEPEPELQVDDGWGSFRPEKSGKNGKKTKTLWDEPPRNPFAPPEPAPEEPAPEPEVKFDDSWGGFGTKKCKKIGKKTKVVSTSKEILKEYFYACKYGTGQHTITIPSPRPNQEPNEDYTPVFLSHAHLYVFARKYDISPLQTLALENLHVTLEQFTLHLERTGDIVELLKYIYSSRELKEGEFKEMREMLKGYIGFEMDVLMKERAFRGLMKEEGELLDDFVEMVGKRI